MKLKDSLIPALAIVLIATMTTIALFRGIDGAVLMSSITIIAGVAGYKVGKSLKS